MVAEDELEKGVSGKCIGDELLERYTFVEKTKEWGRTGLSWVGDGG